MFDFLFHRPSSGSPRRPPAKLQTYWIADCARCGVRSIIGKVDLDAEPFETLEPDETLPITCIHCRFSNHFAAADLRKTTVRVPSIELGPRTAQ